MTPEEEAAAKKAEEDKKPSQYLTKVEMEQMLSAQQAQFTAMITRAVETLAPKTPPAGGNEGERGKVVSFYEKPEEAANALFEAKMAPMRDAYVAGEKSRQLAEVASLPHAGEYLKEIQQVIDAAPALAQIQPGFAAEAYNLVVGRHLKDVIKKLKDDEAKPKPEFTETQTAGAPSPKKSETLSSSEREAAAGMGVSEEDYKKWRDNPDAMAAAALNPTKKAS